MTDQPAREEVSGVMLVHVRRVDVARDRREQVKVLAGERPGEALRVTDVDLVEGPVFEVFPTHDIPPCTTRDGVMCHFGSRSRNLLTIFASGESGSDSAGSSIMIRATIATARSR